MSTFQESADWYSDSLLLTSIHTSVSAACLLPCGAYLSILPLPTSLRPVFWGGRSAGNTHSFNESLYFSKVLEQHIASVSVSAFPWERQSERERERRVVDTGRETESTCEWKRVRERDGIKRTHWPYPVTGSCMFDLTFVGTLRNECREGDVTMATSCSVPFCSACVWAVRVSEQCVCMPVCVSGQCWSRGPWMINDTRLGCSTRNKMRVQGEHNVPYHCPSVHLSTMPACFPAYLADWLAGQLTYWLTG